MIFFNFVIKKMKYSNLHTHSTYCDGKSTIEQIVNEAIKLKMINLGFSSHAPINAKNDWAIADIETLKIYLNEISKIKQNDKINIFAGLEADYVPNLSANFEQLKKEYKLDYLIGAVHLVKNNDKEDLWFIDGPEHHFIDGLKSIYNNDIKTAVYAYFNQIFEMLQTQKFDIIAHFDKIKLNNANRFFDENEKWYKDLTLETLKLIKENDVIMEINTRAFYKKRREDFFPSFYLIKQAKEMDIKIIINSDAHHFTELISGYEEAFLAAKNAGYNEQMCLTNNGWDTTKLFNNEKKYYRICTSF